MMSAHPSLQQMRDELRVAEDFLTKYNRPGPRYTSYPTAPVWNDAFGPDDLERVHEVAERARTPVSLYMHIPFCESLCLFCACNVIIQKNKSVAPPYLGILKRENSLTPCQDRLIALDDYYELVGLKPLLAREESYDRAAASLVQKRAAE